MDLTIIAKKMHPFLDVHTSLVSITRHIMMNTIVMLCIIRSFILIIHALITLVLLSVDDKPSNFFFKYQTQWNTLN